MNQPLLTVIVPCYNVEKYADKCISSVVGQNYANLEILLIDDGSTDTTGMICDIWKEKDRRIRVIHKQNEGVAYARKTGVDHATAEFVTFVDADDWIDVNMYADMMSALLSTTSDVAHCAFCYVYEDGRREEFPRYSSNTVSVQTYNRVESVILNLKEEWWPCLWTKIYKRQLFDHVEIPKGRIFGEDQMDHLLFHHASQIVFLNNIYYFYFQRNDSISRPWDLKTELKKISDVSDLYYERYSFVKQHPEYHEALPFVCFYIVWLYKILLRNIIAYPQCFSKNYYEVKIQQFCSISIIQDDQFRTVAKLDIFFIKISPQLYKILMSMYFQIIHVTNKLKITNRPITITSW